MILPWEYSRKFTNQRGCSVVFGTLQAQLECGKAKKTSAAEPYYTVDGQRENGKVAKTQNYKIKNYKTFLLKY